MPPLSPFPPPWPAATELVGLCFDLVPGADYRLYPQYTIGLHAWFLQQIGAFDPELSAYLHDGEAEKAFNLSPLVPVAGAGEDALQLRRGQVYHWGVRGLNRRVVQGLAVWLRRLPDQVGLRGAPLGIRRVSLGLPPTTYASLAAISPGSSLSLSFTSPTSFRRRGHHLPLPWPPNLFHSYLRRWNAFSGHPVEAEAFLDWVEEGVLILRHQLRSEKIAAGKRGSVTGFTGQVSFGLTAEAAAHPQFCQLFYSLGHYAPYCGTGHKTPFGLGQTHLGWRSTAPSPQADQQQQLADRIDALTSHFLAQKKRTGGHRAQDSAVTWATIVARRELGESLQTIAADLEIPYQTAKTYGKLARRYLSDGL